MADQTPTPTLRELVTEWRKSAQTHANYAHYRDEPYDDVAHEHRVKSQRLRKCADELEAALAAQEAVPQEERRERYIKELRDSTARMVERVRQSEQLTAADYAVVVGPAPFRQQPVEEAVPQPVIAREWFEKGWEAYQWQRTESGDSETVEEAYLVACRLLRNEHEQKA